MEESQSQAVSWQRKIETQKLLEKWLNTKQLGHLYCVLFLWNVCRLVIPMFGKFFDKKPKTGHKESDGHLYLCLVKDALKQNHTFFIYFFSHQQNPGECGLCAKFGTHVIYLL